MIYAAIYILGYFISIFVLKRYAVYMAIPDYDVSSESDWTSDDYDSNAKAYTAFSTIWPIFYTVYGIYGMHILFVKLTKWILNEKK